MATVENDGNFDYVIHNEHSEDNSIFREQREYFDYNTYSISYL